MTMLGAGRKRWALAGVMVHILVAPTLCWADSTYEYISGNERGTVTHDSMSYGAFTHSNLYMSFSNRIYQSDKMSLSGLLSFLDPQHSPGTVSYTDTQHTAPSPLVLRIVIPGINGAPDQTVTFDRYDTLSATYSASGTRLSGNLLGTSSSGETATLTLTGLLSDNANAPSTGTFNFAVRMGTTLFSDRSVMSLLRSEQAISSGFTLDYTPIFNNGVSGGPVIVPTVLTDSASPGSVVLTNSAATADASFIFTKDQRYSGGTTISSGVTLIMPVGVSLGSGSIANSGALVLGVPQINLGQSFTDTDFTLASPISGQGTISKVGASTVTLTGDSSAFSGATTVSNGTLVVNGALGGALTVGSGATLAGSGVVNNVTIQSGGTHAPGSRQTVTGNYTLAAGSVLNIGVSDSQASQVVVTSGAVSLGGSTLSLNALSGGPTTAQPRYTIIDNQGSGAVSGSFAAINNSLAFYDASVSYTAGTGNDVVLTLNRNNKGFIDLAADSNQRGVAGQLVSLPGSDGQAIRNSILGQSQAATQNAYQQLSGNIYPSTTQFNQNVGQQANQQVSARLGSLRSQDSAPSQRGLTQSAAQLAGFSDPGVGAPLGASPVISQLPQANWGAEKTGGAARKGDNGLWGQTIGGFSRQNGDNMTASITSDWAGWVLGYDHAVTDNATLGGYVGYLRGNADQDAIRSSITTDSMLLGLYGEYRIDGWRLDGQLGWSRIATDSQRTLSFGSIYRTAQASYVDQGFTADLEAAHPLEIAKDIWLEPYAGTGLSGQLQGNFTETGADSVNLHRDSNIRSNGHVRLGSRLSSRMEIDEDMVLVPQAGVSWRHLLGSAANRTALSFASNSSSEFSVSSMDSSRDTLSASLGGSLLSNDGWQAYASYAPSVGKDLVEHSFIVGARLEW